MEEGPRRFFILAAFAAVVILLVAVVQNREAPQQRSADKPEKSQEKPKQKSGAALPNLEATERARDAGGAKPERQAQEEAPRRDLYHRAWIRQVTDLPPYAIVDATSGMSQGMGERMDAAVVTEQTRDKAALGSIMVDVSFSQGVDLLVVEFFASSEAYRSDEPFAIGHLAVTKTGRAMISGETDPQKAGRAPFLEITVL